MQGINVQLGVASSEDFICVLLELLPLRNIAQSGNQDRQTCQDILTSMSLFRNHHSVTLYLPLKLFLRQTNIVSCREECSDCHRLNSSACVLQVLIKPAVVSILSGL